MVVEEGYVFGWLGGYWDVVAGGDSYGFLWFGGYCVVVAGENYMNMKYGFGWLGGYSRVK